MSVMIHETAMRLMRSFPGSFVNYQGEFVAHRGANAYFNLSVCTDELQVKCKVLEWLSRSACKSMPFATDRANRKLWVFVRTGINDFLGTQFTESDMHSIYTYLGNAVNHERTIRFIESGYDMRLLSGAPAEVE